MKVETAFSTETEMTEPVSRSHLTVERSVMMKAIHGHDNSREKGQS
jgi:hypothetical protein